MPTLTSPLSYFSSASPHCPTCRLNQQRKRGSGFMVIEDMVMVIVSFLCQEGCGADDAQYYPFTVPNFICIDKEREILAPWSYTRNRHGDNVSCLLIQEGDCGTMPILTITILLCKCTKRARERLVSWPKKRNGYGHSLSLLYSRESLELTMPILTSPLS